MKPADTLARGTRAGCPRAVPLGQHPGFAAALRLAGRNAAVHRLMDGAQAIGSVLILRRGPLATASRGPVWRDGTPIAARVAAVRALVRGGLRLIEADRPEEAEVLAACGFRLVLTPAHVAELDLTVPSPDRRALATDKWRNRLVMAEAADLRVALAPFPADPHHWLLGHEAAQRRRRRYRALPLSLVPAFAAANPGMATLALATRRGAPVAAMLFLRHGAVATYHIGWSGDEGRRLSAHALLLDRAADWLAAQGYRRLDLGLVDTEAGAGLARFKIGAGARVRPLGGGWLRLR